MNFQTGQTINDVFVSVNSNNVPVVPGTFSTNILKDGAIYTGVSLTTSLVEASTGLYQYSFVPIINGNYQVYINNSTTNVIYVSDVFVVSDASTVIYVGL